MVLFANTVNAKSQVLLRLNLQKGSIYEMHMHVTSNIEQNMMGQNMKIVQRMEMILSYKVTDVLPNKNYQIEYSVNSMKLDVDINENSMSFDSQNPDESNPMGTILKTINKMKVTFELTPSGKTEQVNGLDEITSQIASNPQMAQALQMFSDDKNFSSFISETFNYIPENKIKTGDKWTTQFKLPSLMDANTTMNFEVTGITKDSVDLNVFSDVNSEGPVEQNGMKIDMKLTGSQTGTMTVDANDGWVRSSDLNQKFDIHMKLKNPQTGEDMEIPMKVNSVTKSTVEKK
jgi:hypothetical protein